MNYLIEISADCFNVSKRIKAVNKNYKLFYNFFKKHFEVHTDYGIKTKCECILGNKNSLTCELVIKLLKTRKENVDFLIKEIDMENEKRKKQAVETTIKEMQKTLEGF